MVDYGITYTSLTSRTPARRNTPAKTPPYQAEYGSLTCRDQYIFLIHHINSEAISTVYHDEHGPQLTLSFLFQEQLAIYPA